MQIDPNNNINRFTGTTSAKSSRAQTSAISIPGNAASFEHASALENTLAAVPEIRPEAVARARQLIADPNYPSASIVRSLSNFLAEKILHPEDQ